MGESAKDKAKKHLMSVINDFDMTPRSQNEIFDLPTSLVAEAEQLHKTHTDILDTVVEGVRFDLVRCPDFTGAVYGFFISRIIGDPITLAGLFGEAILRLAKLPDPPEDDFDQIAKEEEIDTDD